MPSPPRKRPPPGRKASPVASKKEAFIGHAAKTLVDEDLTFEEMEKKMRDNDATNTTPALQRDPPGEDEVTRLADSSQDVDPEEEDASDDGDSDDEDDDSDEDDDASDSDDDDDDDDDEDEDTPLPVAAGGRPKDRDGVEWDWVTNEGVGFNDDDDEDAMSIEKNGKTYFKPDWGNWKIKDWVGYWRKIFDIEAAQEQGNTAHLAAIRKHGLRNRNHLKRVQATFLLHYGKDPAFTNAALEARQGQTRDLMKDAVKPGMLEPIEGVSLQVYAGISAQRMNLKPPEFVKLLAKHKLDEAKFARVDEGWQKRMSDQSDPMAGAAIATEYGKAFAGAGAGQFGASAQAASGSLGIDDKVAGSKVKGAAPMDFERYVEVMTAQTCWSQQGKDVSQMLQKVFKMTVVDWSNASAHWAQKMSTDITLMTEKFPVLQAKYTEKYSAGTDDADDDLEV